MLVQVEDSRGMFPRQAGSARRCNFTRLGILGAWLGVAQVLKHSARIAHDVNAEHPPTRDLRDRENEDQPVDVRGIIVANNLLSS